MDFKDALGAATAELDASRPRIEANRKKKGKIKEPGAEDRCVVCGMYPAKYPNFDAQISTKEGEVLHFCSSQCLVKFRAEPATYLKKGRHRAGLLGHGPPRGRL